ncbi:MAG: glycosyltransferase family 2 protein [Nanoarchaeota archaeon]|nr:glycosyltransferase family 2 protein [Nanoarchaeota archaeon]
MITIIITSYKEPKSTVRAINAFLEQNFPKDSRIIVCDPFPEVEEYIKENVKDKRVHFFLDPGEGKAYALNLLFQENYSNNQKDIFILTDGDVYVSKNSLKEILNTLKDEKVGCITGRPITTNPRENKYGYWSKVLFDGVDNVRRKISDKGEFFQCSGYLFAIRNGLIKEFPIDVPEDCIIPYLIWKKDYQIKYVPNAEVYVQYPDNWKDWLNQRIRIIKAHENISKLYPEMPRTKSFFNEIKKGAFFALAYPKNLKEFFWTIELFFARLYIYFEAFKSIRKKQVFADGWRETEIESTKPLD